MSLVHIATIDIESVTKDELISYIENNTKLNTYKFVERDSETDDDIQSDIK